MPWTTNDEIIKSIPALKALPGAAITLFRTVANGQLQKGDSESTAVKIAWGVVKKRFEKTGDGWVARTDAFTDVEYYSFNADPAESFITRTTDGVEIHNYVLTDQFPDKFGTAPTVELMNEWADWINNNAPEVDFDHQIMTEARKLFNDDPKRVKEMVRSKKGIAKVINAKVDAGRLLVGIAFDKRYHNHIEKIKGLSIEAAAVRDSLTNKIKKGELLGLTFALNQIPGNPRAVRI